MSNFKTEITITAKQLLELLRNNKTSVYDHAIEEGYVITIQE